MNIFDRRIRLQDGMQHRQVFFERPNELVVFRGRLFASEQGQVFSSTWYHIGFTVDELETILARMKDPEFLSNRQLEELHGTNLRDEEITEIKTRGVKP